MPSRIAWYSGVSGACWPRPAGLSGSHWGLPIRVHCARMSGYLLSSCARTPDAVMASAAAQATRPIGRRRAMACSCCTALLKMPQVRRRLVLPGRHQVSVGAKDVVFAADLNVAVVLLADVFRPDRLLGRQPAIAALHRPRPRQRIVDGCDLGMEHVRIGLVGIDPLLDHRLLVLVERDAAVVVAVRALDATGLDQDRKS